MTTKRPTGPQSGPTDANTGHNVSVHSDGRYHRAVCAILKPPVQVKGAACDVDVLWDEFLTTPWARPRTDIADSEEIIYSAGHPRHSRTEASHSSAPCTCGNSFVNCPPVVATLKCHRADARVFHTFFFFSTG